MSRHLSARQTTNGRGHPFGARVFIGSIFALAHQPQQKPRETLTKWAGSSIRDARRSACAVKQKNKLATQQRNAHETINSKKLPKTPDRKKLSLTIPKTHFWHWIAEYSHPAALSNSHILVRRSRQMLCRGDHVRPFISDVANASALSRSSRQWPPQPLHCYETELHQSDDKLSCTLPLACMPPSTVILLLHLGRWPV